MKLHPLPVIALIASLIAGPALRAQTAPKICIVDLSKLFENHWKTAQEQAKLNEDEAKAQKEIDRLGAEGKALVEELKELDDQTKSPTASNEAKARANEAAQKKYEEIQRKRSEQTEYVQNESRTLHQRMDNFKAIMFEEISKVAVEVAKKHGATLLLDKSGPTMVGVSNIVYYDPSLEITDEVMAALKATRPANLPASMPGAGTAPGATPTITVPGLGK
jgi:outer membrane protein